MSINFDNLPTAGPWLATLVTATLTALVGIWQFRSQRQQSNRQPFLQKQLDLCFEASETAARLATETNKDEWEKARLTFWRLYWGTLSIVEDPKVEVAMLELGGLVPRQPVAEPSLPMRVLERPSLKLAHMCRSLILGSWNVHIDPLKETRS
jgi:hypothetical protein